MANYLMEKDMFKNPLFKAEGFRFTIKIQSYCLE